MDNHRDYINQFCRIFKSSAEKKRRMLVSKCATELYFYYRESRVEFARDNPNCQSQFLCNKCSNNIGKIKKEMNFKRKNPKCLTSLYLTTVRTSEFTSLKIAFVPRTYRMNLKKRMAMNLPA